MKERSVERKEQEVFFEWKCLRCVSLFWELAGGKWMARMNLA